MIDIALLMRKRYEYENLHNNSIYMKQLQERILELEDKVREGETKLKQMQDSLKHEEEMQTRLSYRFVLCGGIPYLTAFSFYYLQSCFSSYECKLQGKQYM